MWPSPGTPADRRRAPNWTTGAKDGVGTANNGRSRVWFTIANGVLTETFFPRVDQANTRDLRFALTDGTGFISLEGSDTESRLEALDVGVPAYRVRTRYGPYELEKIIITDDERATVLQRVKLHADGDAAGRQPRLFVLLAPHIGNQGEENDGWIGDYKGAQMLFARRANRALALGCSLGFREAECTYAGLDDAWHDLQAHHELTVQRPHAYNGNLLLAGEIQVPVGAAFVLALAFGDSPDEAGQQARAALQQDFDHAVQSYVRGWREFHQACEPVTAHENAATERGYRVSAAMLRVHEDKAHSGAIIASLAIPWGDARGDHDEGGYHLVWPRDLVESAGGLLAAGLRESGRLALLYLMSTQEDSGHWPQNMWLDGSAYWHGVQLDETGLPILLADALARHDALDGLDHIWAMVRRAASYIVCNGPATPEDRWEEEAGYSPFTLAVEVAALLAAAEFAEHAGEHDIARYLCETADYWNSCIERWTYVTGTELSHRLGIDGYYVRLAPPASDVPADLPPGAAPIALKNHPMANTRVPYGKLVSPDALALVRFGLRAPDDPRMLNTVRAIDALLRTETQTGPVWHRYTGDGYGEHKDGAAFDGGGIGRGWPLLAGERAHYELAAGNVAEARRLRDVILAQTGSGSLIPEQVWDAPDIPARGLVNGRPSGSAMPLVWAHAELVKLCRSLRDGQVFDMPRQTVRRYREQHTGSPLVVWRRNNKPRTMPQGQVLRVELPQPGDVQWRVLGSEMGGRLTTQPSGLGIAYADLPTRELPPDAEIALVELNAQGKPVDREHTLRVVARGR
ncbi:MAG TPA: glycoside hydrolase family 15 protein [Gemmatimonadaceae bacterium]|nr:glycoside hydrolase family 15 protein [Gemmatimonadaceae bacterium]